jgi:hypothetical protein
MMDMPEEYEDHSFRPDRTHIKARVTSPPVNWPAATAAMLIILGVIAGVTLMCLACFGVFGNPGMLK